MITILSGGTGSIKMIRGFTQINKSVAVILNVGDNIWKYGLYICPDVDTIFYGLSGQLDTVRGWGIKRDSFNFMDQIGKMGYENWFRIGDRDLATHVLRTELIRKGMSLTEVTDYFSSIYKLGTKLVPVSNDHMETRIVTSNGEMNIQEFWIKYRAAPEVFGVKYKGAKKSKLSARVLRLVRESERIIIAPANPISSIGPSLAVPGLKNELTKVKRKVIAISPIIGKKAFSGPAGKYMSAMKLDVSPLGVAKYYSDIIGSFVISKTDISYENDIKKLGMNVYAEDIAMKRSNQERRLASFVSSIQEV
ncbi:MAG TPA: 2-phospho-L-lactate transferase [Nitrososphaeraceae archaeon]|jgi:LPPG:FO 2-phospho-L-lactate transferase|nr:2-phospho-L-lactate transferase [Nitrososphaeraceae archaeon]